MTHRAPRHDRSAFPEWLTSSVTGPPSPVTTAAHRSPPVSPTTPQSFPRAALAPLPSPPRHNTETIPQHGGGGGGGGGGRRSARRVRQGCRRARRSMRRGEYAAAGRTLPVLRHLSVCRETSTRRRGRGGLQKPVTQAVSQTVCVALSPSVCCSRPASPNYRRTSQSRPAGPVGQVKTASSLCRLTPRLPPAGLPASLPRSVALYPPSGCVRLSALRCVDHVGRRVTSLHRAAYRQPAGI